MEIQIIKGNERYMTECVQALKDSELGRQYFSKEGSAEEAVREGLKTDTMYIAVSHEKYMGFMYYIPNGAFHSFPYLHLLVTKQSERGKGVGTEMLKGLERLVDKPKLFLSVADFNPEAKKFYEKYGYIQVGRIDGLYRPGIVENLMMKECKKEI